DDRRRMSTLLRVGVFYGAPVVAVVWAIAYFVVVVRRWRRGILPRSSAALRYASTLLLPVVAVLAIWATAEISSYLASAGSFEWDRAASIDVLRSLLPIGGYVALPIVALNMVLWVLLARAGHR